MFVWTLDDIITVFLAGCLVVLVILFTAIHILTKLFQKMIEWRNHRYDKYTSDDSDADIDDM